MTQETPQNTPREITFLQPDDWHHHLRDGSFLEAVVQDAAKQFGRLIAMPNLPDPITTLAKARDYRKRIEAALQGASLTPLMTLYLTSETKLEDVKEGYKSGELAAIKLYPQGATTNSEFGVSGLKDSYPIFEAMQKLGMPLLIHGEVTDHSVDIFDREKVFVENKLIPLRKDFPELKIVLEHITTKDAADYVAEASKFQAATVTAHHLLINRNDLLVGGIKPHHYCLPIVKRELHRIALVEAVTTKNESSKRFFLGTDSAPHAQNAKESACGCAGIYTGRDAISFYLEAFEGHLNKFEAFASLNGPDFYNLPRNRAQVTYIQEVVAIPENLPYGEEQLVPFRAGGTTSWKRKD